MVSHGSEASARLGAPRVLIIDLNNFARYPSIAVGYLSAVLRSDGIGVTVLSPLARGFTGVGRESPVRPWGLMDQKLRYRTAVSTSPVIQGLRSALARRALPQLSRDPRAFVKEIRGSVVEGIDVVIVSTYLMYQDLCRLVCAICAEKNIPVILGGPYFAQPETVVEWLPMEGLTAIVGGEPEPFLGDLVRTAADRGKLGRFPGVSTRESPAGKPAPPLLELDGVPFPDYSDYPWNLYAKPIVPMITGRGCGWGVCSFCSDITSSAGRTFRSRSSENVLSELGHQAAKHDVRSFVFTDLKLNSNLPVWRSLISTIQQAVPGSRWICSIHVGPGENGLSATELREASLAGLTRLTTGLESGSQRVLDSMKKGTNLADVSKTLRSASAAGISVRTTMILGYPGEQAGDVLESAAFVERHADVLDRVMLNRFQLVVGTRIHHAVEANGNGHSGLRVLGVNHSMAQLAHDYAPAQESSYHRAVYRLLEAVHRINRKKLPHAAREFEGVM